MSAPLGGYKYVGSLFAEAALCYSYVGLLVMSSCFPISRQDIRVLSGHSSGKSWRSSVVEALLFQLRRGVSSMSSFVVGSFKDSRAAQGHCCLFIIAIPIHDYHIIILQRRA